MCLTSRSVTRIVPGPVSDGELLAVATTARAPPAAATVIRIRLTICYSRARLSILRARAQGRSLSQWQLTRALPKGHEAPVRPRPRGTLVLRTPAPVWALRPAPAPAP